VSRHECSHGLNLIERCEGCTEDAFEQGYAAGLEAAALVCEAEEAKHVEAAAQCPWTLNPTWYLGRGYASRDCATAIRALPAAQRGDDKNTGSNPRPGDTETGDESR